MEAILRSVVEIIYAEYIESFCSKVSSDIEQFSSQ